MSEPAPKKQKTTPPSEQKLCKGYDFTIAKRDGDTRESIEAIIRAWFSHYIFQEEKSDNTDKHPDGYCHYQCRGWLIKKRRLNEIKSKIDKRIHVSGPTVSGVHSGRAFNYDCYCNKADTWVAGPWTDQEYKPPPVMTRQLKNFMSKIRYPWQSDVVKMCTVEDDRSVVLILDTIGNSGKSILCEFLAFKELGFEMPPCRSLEDIMGIAMTVPTNSCYLVDMPRGMKKDKLAEFYSGIESLKNGRAYDKRYSFREKRFDRPQVIVFTNTLPQFNLISKDRWQVYEITSDKTLESLDVHDLIRAQAQERSGARITADVDTDP